jgi:hypothetical protein
LLNDYSPTGENIGGGISPQPTAMARPGKQEQHRIYGEFDAQNIILFISHNDDVSFLKFNLRYPLDCTSSFLR